MGFITNVKETGKTIYEVDLPTLKKMVAVDLGINEEAITISAHMVNAGDYRDSYDVFSGLKITVDHSKVTKKNDFMFPAGVRGGAYVDESKNQQVDSPCCGENRKQ